MGEAGRWAVRPDTNFQIPRRYSKRQPKGCNEISSLYKRVEIGFTFLGKKWQRTMMNTEAKLIMLTYAFEELDLNRVEFLTDYLNTPSRQAILRLGAKEEGILRRHQVMRDGRTRDSVIFSIVKDEWQGVKQNLMYKLRQHV